MKLFCYCLVAKSRPLYCDPMDPTGYSVHGILQARILEWAAISFSSGSSWIRDATRISCTVRQILYHCPTRKAWSMKGRKEIGTDSSWTITGATLRAQWVSHTVLGRSSRWARGCWAQLPQKHISRSHLLKTHNTSRKTPPHQGCKEPSPQSWVGREEKPEDKDWAHKRAPDEKGGQGLRGPPWRDPCTPHTGHCSPGTTPRGRSPAAIVNPGGRTGSPGTRLLSWDMHPLMLLEQAKEAAGHCSGLGQFTGQPMCPPAHRCPLGASGSRLLLPGWGPPMLGRVGSVGYRASSDRQDIWTGQCGHQLSESGPRSSVLKVSFSISLTVKSFKSLCDNDPLPHRLSDLLSAPVSPPH